MRSPKHPGRRRGSGRPWRWRGFRGRRARRRGVAGEVDRVGAVGVHHPDLEVAVTIGRERDAGAVRGLSSPHVRFSGSAGLTRIQGPERLWDSYLFLSTYIAMGDIFVSSRHPIESSLEPSGL